MIKKFLSVLLICVILISTVLTAPAHALAVEIIGGSYVAYAILAAALAAAGYTIATSQIDSTTFQAILDSSGAEDIKALITATTVFTSVNGRVFFNWSAQQWAIFTAWVNSVIASGQLVIPAPEPEVPNVSSSFDISDPSCYIAKKVPSSTGLIGWALSSASAAVVVYNTTRRKIEIQLSNALLWSSGSGGAFSNSSGATYYFYGSPAYFSNNTLNFTLGIGVNASGDRVSNVSQIHHVGNVVTQGINRITFNDVVYYTGFSNGVVQLVNYATNVVTSITGTALFPTTYSSMAAWWTDVINTGSLVGDFTGIGEDVINPGRDMVDVGIDSYPNWRVGTGVDSLPDSIDGSIDIPLNRYIETDLGPDVVDPYVDFTPWDTTTVPPDDVIPDTRLNPPADVTADPDTPWADDQSYPIDYPRDTTADIPADPTWEEPDENSDPNENSNRLKLGPLILSKFPFCLPWDLQHALQTLVTPGEAPSFTVPIVNERLGWNTSFTIDFGFADPLARVSRWFLSALWVVILILITRKIVWK